MQIIKIIVQDYFTTKLFCLDCDFIDYLKTMIKKNHIIMQIIKIIVQDYFTTKLILSGL